MAKTDPTQENVNKLLAEIQELRQENNRFAEESVKLLQEIADLKANVRRKQVILRAVEWTDDDGIMRCPYCHMDMPVDEEDQGHHPDCALKFELPLAPVEEKDG
jgi:regulator of replication initiation timing